MEELISDLERPYRLLHETYVLVLSADDIVTNLFDITPIQFRMLSLLDTKDGFRLTYLSDRVLRSKGQTTRIIDQLEEKGLVQRILDPHDRRAQNVIITETGIVMRDKVHEKHLEALNRYMKKLSKEERNDLVRILEKLNSSLLSFIRGDVT
jgi:DNA-binding MarR family transcriptional regulator